MIELVNKIQDLLEGWPIKSILSAIGVFIWNLAGADHVPYEVIFTLITIDFLIGFTYGFVNKKISSHKMRKGCRKLALYLIVIVSSHQLHLVGDWLLYVEQGVIGYIAVSEFISIIENTEKLGFPMPIWLKDRLEGYVKKGKI